MYLYLGGDAVVRRDELVGIFDLDNASWSLHTRRFLTDTEREGRLRIATEDIPKSLVVCGDGTVILAQPNTAILVKRLNDQEKYH